jgi:hypothetical protein
MEVGIALLEVRDNRLYREKFSTFEEYCRERWKMTRQRANQLIAASEVAGTLTTCVVKPQTEAQVRPLTTLDPRSADEAWKRALDISDGEQPTGEQVKRAVENISVQRKSSIKPQENEAAVFLEKVDRLIESAPHGRVVFIVQDGDRIIIRDNSGVTGLVGESLMNKTRALIEELFPEPIHA